jgi:two-component system, cell cycle sensor histidine kinase and response regulator CckA
VATFGLSALSLASPLEAQGTALFWLGAGFSLGLLVVLPRGVWPPVLAAVFGSCLISNALHDIPPALNVAFALANVAEPVLAAWLYRRWRDAQPRSLVAQAVALALVAALGSVCGATIGTAALAAAGRVSDVEATFGLWFIDDLLGALVVAPLLVAWWPNSEWSFGKATRRFWSELGGFTLVVLLAGVLTFWRDEGGSLALVALYLHLALLLLGAVRLGPRGATLASLVLSVCAVLGTLQLGGPFMVVAPGVMERATALQGYLAVTALVGLVPAMLISERTRVAEQHREREREIEAILQSLGDAVVVTDQQRRVRYANPAAEALSGFERGAMLGRPFGEVVALEDTAGGPDLVGSALEQDTVVRSTEPRRLLRADGRERWTSLTAAPFEDESGRVRGAAIVLSDESERRAHGAKLQEAERQLVHSQKLHAVGELAAGVAHDFNNILMVITASAEILRMDAASDLQPLVDDVLEACDKAARLTTQLLVFNRKDSFELLPLDLNEVTEGLSKMLHRLLGEDIALVTDRAPDRLVISADRGQLEQIILNLSVNARDAMPAGGKLSLRVKRAGTAALDSVPVSDTGYALLEVEDSGHGIDDATLERIFEPFFTTKPAGSGTGLGLATVQTICARHQGHVRVSSTLGKGTCFRVFLPLLSEAGLHAPSAEPGAVRGQGERVLLIEDNQELQRLVQKLLQRAGFQVTVAHGAIAALQLLAARPFDLLLSDVVMPDMNGRELAERARIKSPHLAVLFMSGYSSGVLEQRISGLSGYRLLRKPFSASALTSAVLSTLSDSRKRAGESGGTQRAMPSSTPER